MKSAHGSPFWAAIHKKDPQWSPPAMSPLTHLVPDLDGRVHEVKHMVTYGPYLKLRSFMAPDPVTNALVLERWVQVRYRENQGDLLQSAPQTYDDFLLKFKLLDRLQVIADEVSAYMKFQQHSSEHRKIQGLGASPFMPNVLLDVALENGEVTLDELEVYNG